MLLVPVIPNCRVALFAFLCITVQSIDLCAALQEADKLAKLPLSADHVVIPGETTFKPSYATVDWDGRVYDEKEGTIVLLNVITNPAIDNVPIRARALQRLARFRNKEITPRLIESYNHFSSIQVKIGIIECLSASEDPRSLPLFAKILNEDNTKVVRLAAAAALAQWNIRQGVAELVTLLESNERIDQPARWPLVRDFAIDHFSSIGHRKGWGFPEKQTRESIMERSDLDENAKFALFVTELKKWWANNEQRFPDWKPGDTLPPDEGNESATPVNP